MKIGDKIRVMETGRVGWIIGETRTGWKIDFEGGNKPELVLKTVLMEVITHQGGSGGYQGDGSKPKKKMKWLLLTGVIIVIIIIVVLMVKSFIG